MKGILILLTVLMCACAKEGHKRQETQTKLPLEELTPGAPPQVFLVGGTMKTPGVYITEKDAFPSQQAVCEVGPVENPLRFTLFFTSSDEKDIVYVSSFDEAQGISYEDYVTGLVTGGSSIQNVVTRLVMNEDLKSGKLEASVTYKESSGTLISTDFQKITDVYNCSFGEMIEE